MSIEQGFRIGLLFIFAGDTKLALKVLMHTSCPSVDERNEHGHYRIICSVPFYVPVAFLSTCR